MNFLNNNNNSALFLSSSINFESSLPHGTDTRRSLKMHRISARDLINIITEPYKTTKLKQPKNYLQKLYEIKSIHPIQFNLISSKGPAHKPQFEMKLVLNSVNEVFISNGISKKQAKLNASKEALKYLTNLDEKMRNKYLNEDETLEIKGLFLQEINDTPPVDTNSSVNSLNELSFTSDCGSNTDLFINFTKSNESTVINTSIKSSSSSESFSLQSASGAVTISKKLETKLNNSSSNNPISLLTELLPTDSYKFEFVDEWGESHAKQFKMQLVIKIDLIKDLEIEKKDEKEKIYYALGSSKKQAKTRVAQIAIQDLFNIKLNICSSTLPRVYDEQFKHFADAVCELIKDKCRDNLAKLNKSNNQLLAAAPAVDDDSKLRTVYAAIVQTNDSDLSIENSKVIGITSGTKCINGEYMSQIGAALNDCHAEILACRILRKYLYEQLDAYLDYFLKKIEQKTPNDDSIVNENNFIFEIRNENDDENQYTINDIVNNNSNNSSFKNLFRLKQNVRFHLYISTTPCGDGRVFALHENHSDNDSHPNRKARGLLRVKLEAGEGTIPLGNEHILQTWDGILQGERLRVMSCSDKLCKLNVVGVQGALLCHFIDPIYFDSVIIGSYYHHEHMLRALYGRLDGHLGDLPTTFKLNKPILSPVTNKEGRQLGKSSNKAYLWSDVLTSIKQEVINTKDGKQIDTKIPSGVSKYELFKSWLNLFKKIIDNKNKLKLNAKLIELSQVEEFTYWKIKEKSTNYQKAKICLYEAFKEVSLGCWITKPFEQDYFDMKLQK